MTDKTLQPEGAAGKGLTRRNFLTTASLALVTVTAIGAEGAQAERARAEPTVDRHRPEGVPEGARNFCSYDCEDSGVSFVTWGDAPVSEGDFVIVETRDENCVGRYYPAPGGCIKLEYGDGGRPAQHVFKPSDVLLVARVMHLEFWGEVIKAFPLKGGE